MSTSTTVWAVVLLVLAVAWSAAAVALRRGGPERPGASVWPLAVAALLAVLAVLVALAEGTPSLAPAGDRVVAVLLGLVLPGLALTHPDGVVDGLVERAAAAVVGVCGAGLVVEPTGPVAVGLGVGVVTATAAGVWSRCERSRDRERERVLWLLLGAGGAGVVGGHVSFALEEVLGRTSTATSGVIPVVACGLAVPVALVVAHRAPRALDVRTLIARVAATVVMTDLALGVFVGGLAAFELLAGRAAPRGIVGLAMVAVAAAFHPAWLRVRDALDQVLFGGRPDPVGVVTTLGDELSRGGGPQQWLDALRHAADLPFAELRQEGEVAAASGRAEGPTAAVALRAGPDHVGDLVVGLPEHHQELPRTTEAVLRLVAGPLARALQSARLAEELARSRRLVVMAAEDERRRLRRDLHDGLGPVLAGVAYTADAARNVLVATPGRAGELLGDLRADVAGAIGEVRRIVHDLRPPVLDQLGLVAALRQQAARIAGDGAGLAVTVDAEPASLGSLPAAVEVAAYRVVSEAVLNVARHAGAGSARATLRRRAEVLEVLVVDDGPGTAPWEPGVGLTSMRERLDELGGELEAASTPSGGRVAAWIPLAVSPGR